MYPPLNITVRVDKKTEEIYLCWDESRYGSIVSRVGFYSVTNGYYEEGSIQYYRDCTKPSKDLELNQKLYENFTKNWEGNSKPRLRKKLARFQQK